MYESQLKELGFERVNVKASPDEEEPFYYYRYTIGDFTLVSSTNLDQAIIVGRRRWAVSVKGIEGSRFVFDTEVKRFINWIKNRSFAPKLS